MNSGLSCGVLSGCPVPPMINAVAVRATRGVIDCVPASKTVAAIDSTMTPKERNQTTHASPQRQSLQLDAPARRATCMWLM